ncbi:unnamed protein product [Amoebophrya sp. A25]|nr:unnamed protein product [Amoebophrya sp. A25]|eukprot:GSA25T00010096001.1
MSDSAQRVAVASGMRTANRRPGKEQEKAKESNSSMSNMLRFSSDDGAGTKVSPVTVLVMSLSYMVIVVFLHIVNKFKLAMGGNGEL